MKKTWLLLLGFLIAFGATKCNLIYFNPADNPYNYDQVTKESPGTRGYEYQVDFVSNKRELNWNHMYGNCDCGLPNDMFIQYIKNHISDKWWKENRNIFRVVFRHRNYWINRNENDCIWICAIYYYPGKQTSKILYEHKRDGK